MSDTSKVGSGRGAWVAQSVNCLTSAQVMILQTKSLSPMLGSVLTAQGLEPASDFVSPSLSLSLSKKGGLRKWLVQVRRLSAEPEMGVSLRGFL